MTNDGIEGRGRDFSHGEPTTEGPEEEQLAALQSRNQKPIKAVTVSKPHTAIQDNTGKT